MLRNAANSRERTMSEVTLVDAINLALGPGDGG